MNRHGGLDVLRAVAIVLVIVHHVPIFETQSGVLAPLINAFDRFGWSGVDLFFVLSGFLIGGLIFNEIWTHGSFDPRRFLARRLLRIWPSYYLLVLASGGVMAIGLGIAGAVREVVPNFLHYQNYVNSRTILMHTWSLAVEEHFYVLLPLVVVLFPWRRGKGSSPRCLVAVLMLTLPASLGARYYTASTSPYSLPLYYNPTHHRIDALAFGVLLAYLRGFHSSWYEAIRRRGLLLLCLGLVLLFPAMAWDRSDLRLATWGLTSLYLGYGLLVVFVDTLPASTWDRLGTIRRIGMASYPIYLWHVLAAKFPLKLAVEAGWFAGLNQDVRWLLVTALMLASSVVVGIVLGDLVENPVSRLRDRYAPARARAIEPDTQQAA